MPRLARALLLACAALAAATAARAQDVTVFAAASLKNALDAVAAQHQTEGGRKVVISYAASSALARQIESGAPADLFMSADLDWMDYLQERNLIRPETRRTLLRNRLVLVAPANGPAEVRLEPGAIAAALGTDGRLAMGQVSSVPAGKYGKAALETLGLWKEASGRLAEAENVRAALLFVSRGEAPLGVVYETDARADPQVRIVARFPETSHPPIVYPAALTRRPDNPEAVRFLDRLQASAADAIFVREGFTPID